MFSMIHYLKRLSEIIILGENCKSVWMFSFTMPALHSYITCHFSTTPLLCHSPTTITLLFLLHHHCHSPTTPSVCHFSTTSPLSSSYTSLPFLHHTIISLSFSNYSLLFQWLDILTFRYICPFSFFCIIACNFYASFFWQSAPKLHAYSFIPGNCRLHCQTWNIFSMPFSDYTSFLFTLLTLYYHY